VGLREHAEAALADNYRLTADYAFSTEGLVPDPKILSHVKRALKKQAANPLDQLAEDERYLTEIRKGEGRYAAATLVGLDPVLIMRRLRIDDDFRDRVHVAEAQSLEKIVKKVRELAEDGEKWAALKMLESKNPDEYDLNPKNNGINVHVNVGVIGAGGGHDPLMKELRELEADLRAQQALRSGADNLPMLEIEEAETVEE
jgi:hypothetical protein